LSTVYGLQSTIYITFDNNHLPNTIVSNSTTVATYAFNGVNAPITKKLGNTVSLNIEYSNRYQIKKHDWKLNGNTIAGYNYGHDSVGNRIWSENLVTSNKSELFAFDNADRLTSFKTGTLNGSKTAIITPIYTQDWSLDSIGNWAGFNDNGTNSTNVFSDTHAMTEFKGVIQTFDNNGNLIFDGVRAFKYDAFNRIIEVKIGTIILAEYQYDAFNRRVVKEVDADLNRSFDLITKLLYDGFRCIEELNGSDVLVQDYVYGSLYIDEVILQRTGVTDYYFTYDYRYSVTSLTNNAGSIFESYDYKVYGERTASGSGLTTVGYTGQRHDSETGLMYFKNRYYSTSLGSFVTKDPLGYVDGLSMYLGYFGGQWVDPSGLAGYFFDGTGNNRTDPSLEDTHVAHLYYAYSGNKKYKNGVGTEDDLFWLGSGSGLFAKSRIDEMMSFLEIYVQNGDKDVDIFGFSRGAAMAREFANRINDKYCGKIKVRFLGLFDTVAQIGLPDPLNINSGVRLDIPSNVEYTAHAVARDEHRTLFPLTSIAKDFYTPWYSPGFSRDDYKVRSGTNWVEMPFRGAHSDVGGGYGKNDKGGKGSNYKALLWMADQAIAHKVPIDKSVIQAKIDSGDIKYPDSFPTFHDSMSTFEREATVFPDLRVVFGGNLE